MNAKRRLKTETFNLLSKQNLHFKTCGVDVTPCGLTRVDFNKMLKIDKNAFKNASWGENALMRTIDQALTILAEIDGRGAVAGLTGRLYFNDEYRSEEHTSELQSQR